jgi:hypothetical protein
VIADLNRHTNAASLFRLVSVHAAGDTVVLVPDEDDRQDISGNENRECQRTEKLVHGCLFDDDRSHDLAPGGVRGKSSAWVIGLGRES